MLDRIDREDAEEALDLLIEWPGQEVTARLLERTRSERWWERQNAFLVLKTRGEAAAVDKEALAILDLLHGPTCIDR